MLVQLHTAFRKSSIFTMCASAAGFVLLVSKGLIYERFACAKTRANLIVRENKRAEVTVHTEYVLYV